MATTWIEVVDTAVKVGLGALITGVVSVGLVFATIMKETVMDRRNRRLKRLEDVSEACERYFNYAVKLASTTAWHWANDLDGQTSKRTKADYDKYIAAWDDALDQLNSASSRLLLLDHEPIADALRRAADLVDKKLREIETEGTSKEQEAKFENFRSEVSTERKEIVRLLRAAYRREGEVERAIGPTSYL